MAQTKDSGLIATDSRISAAGSSSATIEFGQATDRAKAVRIRRCRAEDATALFELFGSPDYQRAALPEPFASPDAVAEWLNACRATGFQVVAELGATVVGFAGLYSYTGRQSHAGFFTVGVLPQHQRCGIGTALPEEIVVAADTFAGLRRLELTVLADNTQAISLYRRLGFTIEGRHRCFVQDGNALVDGLTMARVIGDAIA